MLNRVALRVQHLTAREFPDPGGGGYHRIVPCRHAGKQWRTVNHRQTVAIAIVAADNGQMIGAVGPATEGSGWLARNARFLRHSYRQSPAARRPHPRAGLRKSVELRYIRPLLHANTSSRSEEHTSELQSLRH